MTLPVIARRRFLLMLSGAATTLLLPGLALAAKKKAAVVRRPAAKAGKSKAVPRELRERRLSFFHMHTHESLETVYWADGWYLPDALAEVSWLLRDFRNDLQVDYDPQLLDLLHNIRRTFGSREPYLVVSGFRSPETNDALRDAGRNVAGRSMHLEGKAIDVRIPKVSVKRLNKLGLQLAAGGVGYYPRNGFVHLDTGRVRQWRG